MHGDFPAMFDSRRVADLGQMTCFGKIQGTWDSTSIEKSTMHHHAIKRVEDFCGFALLGILLRVVYLG